MDHWPTCSTCDAPRACREQDECYRDGHSLFRMWEHEQKVNAQMNETSAKPTTEPAKDAGRARYELWQQQYPWRRPWDELPAATQESWRQAVRQEQAGGPRNGRRSSCRARVAGVHAVSEPPRTQTTVRLSLDFETASEVQLSGPKSAGIWNYMSDLTTRPLMVAWRWNSGDVEQVDFTAGDRLPPEVREGLLDPHVEKWAFNAAFERLATRFLLGIKTPIQGWRCTMALAYMRSFSGGLGDVGHQLGIKGDQLKDKRGSALVKLFSMPQRPTKKHPYRWRDYVTDLDAWKEFLAYNRQDVIAEDTIFHKLIGFGVLPEEWALYEIDQEINDRGLPVDMQFVRMAKEMAARRKIELTDMLREVTFLSNPNSTVQLLPWLQERGYPFADLQKNTIKKVIGENNSGENAGFLEPEAERVLKLRQQVSRTSVKKYDAIERRIGDDSRLRHCFQFAGAGRTNRWAGRGPQPQNLVRTPKELEGRDGDFSVATAVTEAIRGGRYDELRLLIDEPMQAFAGAIRSSFRAPLGYEFVVCDLTAIESAVIAWLSGCKRMLGVFRNGLDPYKDFGTELYQKPYDQITKEERTICKPPTLGCGFGLGGGKLKEGKRTGLWGYAEAMGVDISQQEAKRQVDLFRNVYSEIPAFWKNIEVACARAYKGQVAKVGHLTFRRKSNFITMRLPSGREVFYHRPRYEKKEFIGKDDQPYERIVFTCKGSIQGAKKWGSIISGGPKICENAVQATARDVLANGVHNAKAYGFKIVGTVHDEIIALRRKGDNYFTLEALKECMIGPKPWMAGLPLGAAGYVGEVYRKD